MPALVRPERRKPSRHTPLHTYIYHHLARKKHQHEQGECGGRDCPYCDHEKQVKPAVRFD